MSIKIRNSDLVDLWLETPLKERISVIFSFVCEKLTRLEFDRNNVRKIVYRFNYDMNNKWKEAAYKKERFIKWNSSWLQWAVFETEDPDNIPSTSTGKRGRPQVEFSVASEKSKSRKISKILEEHSKEEITYAARKVTKSEKEPDNTIKKCLEPFEALALCLDLDLSEEKYNKLRKVVNNMHTDCFPSTYELNKFKHNLVPHIEATETSAEVNLKALLHITAKHILEVCSDKHPVGKLSLICKWGMDGSSGHSRYKQKFSVEDHSDEFIFVIALLPIKLIDSSSGNEIWVNRTPSSTLFCRPVKFIYTKEGKEVIHSEYNKMVQMIDDLECDIFKNKKGIAEISYVMHCTMIDGAVANVLTNTNSSSRCFICHASPTEMNNIAQNKIPNPDHYKFGLSTLHCWIRFFECLLHIPYRLPFKKWQVRIENKAKFIETKTRIQKEFRDKTGLIIDQVKQGFGTTNDGNTARLFLKILTLPQKLLVWISL